MADRQMIAVADIVVGDRARMDKGDVEDMAVSLLRFGQLMPIILDSSNGLIAGERRLLGAQLNGWTEIWAVYQDNITPTLALEIELEENIRRKSFTPAEEIQAIAKLDELKRLEDPTWGQTQTAIATGVQRSQVSTATKYAKMVELFPELKDAKSVRQLISQADRLATNINRVVEVRDNVIDYVDIERKIILGDSVEVIKTIPSESFAAHITDPPFGIRLEERRAGTSGSASDYEDSEESYERLLTMAPDLFRTLKPNGWCIWFLGISWYERAKQVFRASGFVVDEIPIIWDRSEGRCYTARPDRYFARAYDIALHCFKGEPKLLQYNKPNILRVKPVENQETLVERPVELYEELIRRLTVPGETIADWFVGSGSCPAAAAKSGRDYFGVERDPSRRAYALKKIRGYTPNG